jgi:uncharacterized protein (DUF1810 family)
MSAVDAFHLARFVEAQSMNYADALAELRAGRKTTHWMWYVFPQLRGLGLSDTALFFGLSGADEARAYLAHPVLGPRLLECAAALLAIADASAAEVLGSPDDLKLRSCATLFAHVSPPGSVFERILERYYEGVPDQRTTVMLGLLGRDPTADATD